MKASWSIRLLGDVCEIRHGANHKEVEAPDGRFPIYGSGGPMGFAKEYRCPAKTVLIGRKGTLNKPILVQTPCWNIDTAYGLIPSETIHSSYLFYFCLSTDFTALNPYSGRPSTTAASIAKIPIPLPPLSEQKRIVGILDAAFKKIDAVQRNAERNLANAKELFQRVLDEEMTNFTSFLHLRDVCSITTGKLNANAAVAGGKYPFFTCSKEISQIDSFSFDCEALLLAGNNASGDFNVKYYNGKFNAYQRTYVIHNFQNYRPELIFHILVHNLASLKNVSLGVNTRYLKIGMIESIILPKIPLEQQMVLAKRLSRVCDLCNSYCEKYSAIKRNCLYVKQQILNRAFNGEL